MARFLIKNLSEKDWKVTVGQFNYDCGFKAKGPEEQGRLQEKILKPDSRVAFDPGSRSITMNLSYADFMDRYPTTKQYLVSRAPKTAATPKEDFINAFGTEEEKSHMAKMLEALRDHYRDFDFEDQDDPGIDPSQRQAEQTKALLGKVANPGILLGGGHGDKNTKDLLIDNMKNGTISPGAGTGLVFIEEIKAVFQPLVDEYLDGPDDAPLPGVLGALFEKLGNQMPYQDFAGILKTAKEKKVRVYGLDTGDANPECSNTSAQHPEQRLRQDELRGRARHERGHGEAPRPEVHRPGRRRPLQHPRGRHPRPGAGLQGPGRPHRRLRQIAVGPRRPHQARDALQGRAAVHRPLHRTGRESRHRNLRRPGHETGR